MFINYLEKCKTITRELYRILSLLFYMNLLESRFIPCNQLFRVFLCFITVVMDPIFHLWLAQIHLIAPIEPLSVEDRNCKQQSHLNKKNQDKAPSHFSAVDTSKIYECQFELINHPLYLSDLTLSDYFLCLGFQVWLGVHY